MIKLIVQIPCFNEEATLAETIGDIPRQIEGVDRVEILVIDDGSTDRTAEVAKASGADHVVSNPKNIGLAQSFQRGLDACLSLGADFIVNTDGDNQYCGRDIPKLIAPLVSGDADIVVGDRRPAEIAHFSPLKRLLQKFGSRAVSGLAGVEVADAVSGFRAYTRQAAMGVTVRSTFSYTTETLIQAGRKRRAIVSIPIRTNKVERPSRLFRSVPQFLSRTGRTMLRAYAMYEPLKIFLALGVVLMAVGMAPIARFLVHYFLGDGAGMIQSLILGGVLFLVGGVCALFALIADLIAYNRQLLELTLERVRKIEYAMDENERRAAKKKRFPAERLREELSHLKDRIGGQSGPR